MNDDNDLAIHRAMLGPLAFLSLQHPARHSTPAAPSNEDRFRAYRNLLPALPGNNYAWAFRHAVLHLRNTDG